jgi:hypothetical protein
MMRPAWLERLWARLTPDMEGATLDVRNYFEVSAPRDHARFIRSLAGLLPEASILYFEGTAVVAEVSAVFDRYVVADPSVVARGTIWPTPETFHVCANSHSLEAIASLFEKHAAPEICDYFHAYCNQLVVLQWHDAFINDPLLLSGLLDESAIIRFCNTNDCSYERHSHRTAHGESR